MIFERLWNRQSRRLTRTSVTLRDVQQAIRQYNREHPKQKKVNDGNPANFFKDFARQRERANTWWPPAVFAMGYTARQKTGGGQSFEFVPIVQGQREPFPSTIPDP